MRNVAKDEIEMAARRQSMLDEGFRLFAERGIEAVPMQDVAKACHLGIATVYRYYNSKLTLAIDIAIGRWKALAAEAQAIQARLGTEAMTAAEELRCYLDCYIDIYRNHRDLLCFYRSFSAYIRAEGATPEQLRPYRETMSIFPGMFHRLYEKGRADGSIRTELSEERMFTATSHIMMAVAVRFAQGLDSPGHSEADRTEELTLLRDMILNTFVV